MAGSFRISESSGLTVCSQSVSQSGLLDCWIAGLPDCWIAGLPDCRIAGLLDCWIAGLLDCWIAGLYSNDLNGKRKTEKRVAEATRIIHYVTFSKKRAFCRQSSFKEN
jgi:hypothetical protein